MCSWSAILSVITDTRVLRSPSRYTLARNAWFSMEAENCFWTIRSAQSWKMPPLCQEDSPEIAVQWRHYCVLSLPRRCRCADGRCNILEPNTKKIPVIDYLLMEVVAWDHGRPSCFIFLQEVDFLPIRTSTLLTHWSCWNMYPHSKKGSRLLFKATQCLIQWD